MRPGTMAAAVVFLLFSTLDGHAAGRQWRSIRGPNVIVFGQQSAGTLRGVAVEIEQFRLVGAALSHGARPPLPLPTLGFAFDHARALQPHAPLREGKPIAM